MRRAKKPLHGAAAGLAIILCAFLLLPVEVLSQAGGATPSAAGTGGQASVTPTPGGVTPAGVGAENREAETAKAGDANRQAGGTNFAAGWAGRFERWSPYVAAAGFALGLLSLVACLFMWRRLRGVQKAIKKLTEDIQPFLPSTGAGLPLSLVDGAGHADGVPSMTDAGQGQSTPHEAGELASELDLLISRVDEIEGRLDEVERAPAQARAGADVIHLPDEAEGAQAVRPPQKVTVDKMLEWAGSAGLRLEPVKATFGLFGNFSSSDDGDNWLAIADGDSYLFPRVKRFESGSHFKSDYVDYYDCDDPSAGTVVIDRPATVSSDSQGGWKLVNKGKLSVAAS